MHLSRYLTAALLAGLLMAPAAAADTATADLFAARDDCGGTDNPRLDFSLGGYSDACGSLGQPVAHTEESFASANLNPLFELDTTRNAVISVTGSSRESLGYGIGDQVIEVTLTAKDTKNKLVTLFSGSQTKPAAAMLGGANYTAEFQVPLAGKPGPFKSYTLDISMGGSIGAGYLSTGGDTLVSLPVADDAIIFPPEEEF